MKFSIKDFFRKCDQIRSFLRIWSHLLKKSLMEKFIFCGKEEEDFGDKAIAVVSETSSISSVTPIHQNLLSTSTPI